MILTITANPSVDISYQLDHFIINDVNRVYNIHKDAGGKGIHVGYVLKQLGHEVVNSGFAGGKLGEFICDCLKSRGLISKFIEIDGETRNCIALLHNGKQTEILEKGPEISKVKEEEFINSLDCISKNCKIINISGSLPKGIDSSFYRKIIAYGKSKGKFVSVDTSGKTLVDVINADIKPDLIKPNETEIKDIIKKSIKSLDDLKKILSNKPFAYIDNIIVSMGKDGAFVKMHNKFYIATVPEINAINPVGSGDSALAGALSAIYKRENDIEVIKKSMTCGLLNAINYQTAKIDLDLYDKYYKKIEVKEL